MLKTASSQEFIKHIKSGNIGYLSRAITLVESENKKHQQKASEILEGCLKHNHKTVRIGITGVPGVGKSTFIESFGKLLTSKGNKVAVLTVDPSSVKSKGSILGDKTRMESLSNDSNAYIRPTPSGDSLGGVAKKTRETIRLCEAAGYNYVLIETVGVGQSEIEVRNMVDFFLLLKLANSGDELQGIKRGIIEMADLIVINKADGNFIDQANIAKAEFERSLHLFPPKKNGWVPKVTTCSSIHHKGILNVLDVISKFVEMMSKNEHFIKNRKEQDKEWFFSIIVNQLKINFFEKKTVKNDLEFYISKIKNNETTPFKAAQELLTKNT